MDIQVLKIVPGQAPEAVTMSNTLEAFQAAVGGYIETVGLDANVVLVCNEEGKNLGLPLNRPLTDNHGLPYDMICGTFFLAGLGAEDFVSLTEDQLRQYKEMYDNMMIIDTGRPIPQEKHTNHKKRDDRGER